MIALEKLASRVIKLNAHDLLNSLLANQNLVEYILDLNRINQLFDKGEDTEGEVIGLYSATTEFLSGGEKRQGEHFTLKDTGEFYQSFRIILEGKAFIIEANTIKENNDLLKYSANLLGLNEDSKQRLVEVLKYHIIPQIQKAILLNK